MYVTMYDKAISSMISQLLQSSSSGLSFIAEQDAIGSVRTPKGLRMKLKMDHLVCFVPGMLALGAFHAYVCVDCG